MKNIITQQQKKQIQKIINTMKKLDIHEIQYYNNTINKRTFEKILNKEIKDFLKQTYNTNNEKQVLNTIKKDYQTINNIHFYYDLNDLKIIPAITENNLLSLNQLERIITLSNMIDINNFEYNYRNMIKKGL